MAFKMYNFNFSKDLPKIIMIDKTGLNVSGLFDYLESEYGSEIKKAAIDNGKLAPKTRVAINGKQVYDLNDIIPDGCELLLTFMLAGG